MKEEKKGMKRKEKVSECVWEREEMTWEVRWSEKSSVIFSGRERELDELWSPGAELSGTIVSDNWTKLVPYGALRLLDILWETDWRVGFSLPLLLLPLPLLVFPLLWLLWSDPFLLVTQTLLTRVSRREKGSPSTATLPGCTAACLARLTASLSACVFSSLLRRLISACARYTPVYALALASCSLSSFSISFWTFSSSWNGSGPRTPYFECMLVPW